MVLFCANYRVHLYKPLLVSAGIVTEDFRMKDPLKLLPADWWRLGGGGVGVKGP